MFIYFLFLFMLNDKKETQAKFDLEPSLTHVETLLKDLNAIHLPTLVTQFSQNDISKLANERSNTQFN